ncbi:hypothetical protein AB0K05_13035 [Nonomuraea sp. NPDC049486]|uniref:hypothetical protein n=1 Tax=Nonomuraea sp. NPDC049486 TaxID=3155773 RepID=UPI00343E3263
MSTRKPASAGREALGRGDGVWPDGERPSGWPGTDPGRNVRDLYDEIENGKRGVKADR